MPSTWLPWGRRSPRAWGGDGQAGLRFLGEAFRLDLPAGERTRIAFLLELIRSTSWSGAEGIRAYARAVRGLLGSGDADEAMYALRLGALRAHWTNLDEGTRSEFAAVAEYSPDRRGDPQSLVALAL